MRLDLDLHIVRSDSLEMLAEESCDGLAVLVRNKSHGNLCMGNRRENGLCALTDVSAPDAVHIQTWTDAGSLESTVTSFSLNLLDIKEFLIFFHIERSL